DAPLPCRHDRRRARPRADRDASPAPGASPEPALRSSPGAAGAPGAGRARAARARRARRGAMRSGLAVLALALPAVAAAHPLGNFTVNRYAALRVEARMLSVRYVADREESFTLIDTCVMCVAGRDALRTYPAALLQSPR